MSQLTALWVVLALTVIGAEVRFNSAKRRIEELEERLGIEVDAHEKEIL